MALDGTLATEIQERRWLARPPRPGKRQSGRALRHSPERFDQARQLPCRCVRRGRDHGQFRASPGHRPPGCELQVEAVADDGTIEAVSVKGAPAFAVGVQWHPEYWVHSDSASAKIFRHSDRPPATMRQPGGCVRRPSSPNGSSCRSCAAAEGRRGPAGAHSTAPNLNRHPPAEPSCRQPLRRRAFRRPA